MAHSLDSMGPPLAQAKYEVDYASTRLSTTPDGVGSVFVYRPLRNMGIFFRGYDQQPGFSCQPMVFSGCVIEMSVMQSCREFRTQHVKLGLPPNPNEAAQDIRTLQLSVLREISVADINNAGEPCTVGWGSRNDQHESPEIVVSVRQEGKINRHGKRTGYTALPFQCGDDIIVKGTLHRVDSYERGILNMRYILVAAIQNKLRVDQLRSTT